MRDDPKLRGKPVIVGGSPSGRGVVAAASYEVRRYGVHSAMSAARAKRLCPHAIIVRPDFSRYRREADAIFEIYRRFTPLMQPASLDEAYLDVTDHLGSFSTGMAIAKEIRRLVRKERSLTVSVGVGPNRLIAKIASDFRKPDGLTVVHPGRVRAFLDPLPVRKLHGVGPSTERALHALGIRTVAQLRAARRQKLVDRFGEKWGGMLTRIARGKDDRPVVIERERKSLGHERTFRTDLRGLRALEEPMGKLVGLVADGLSKRQLTGRTITVKVRYGDFETLTRSATLPLPTSDEEVIGRYARRLLRKTEAARRPVRLLGVTVSNMVRREDPQLLLF
jgi:DNA polymerase-4